MTQKKWSKIILETKLELRQVHKKRRRVSCFCSCYKSLWKFLLVWVCPECSKNTKLRIRSFYLILRLYCFRFLVILLTRLLGLLISRHLPREFCAGLTCVAFLSLCFSGYHLPWGMHLLYLLANRTKWLLFCSHQVQSH